MSISIPALIDPSLIAIGCQSQGRPVETFVKTIRDNGQQVPILVRPQPDRAGRGIRLPMGIAALRACSATRSPVRAMVRPLSDQELVVAQARKTSTAKIWPLSSERCSRAARRGGYTSRHHHGCACDRQKRPVTPNLDRDQDPARPYRSDWARTTHRPAAIADRAWTRLVSSARRRTARRDGCRSRRSSLRSADTNRRFGDWIRALQQ